MNVPERNEVLEILVLNYIYYKNRSKVFGREESSDLYIALGKLLGFCMAFNLNINEDDKYVSIKTRRGKLIINVSK